MSELSCGLLIATINKLVKEIGKRPPMPFTCMEGQALFNFDGTPTEQMQAFEDWLNDPVSIRVMQCPWCNGWLQKRGNQFIIIHRRNPPIEEQHCFDQPSRIIP